MYRHLPTTLLLLLGQLVAQASSSATLTPPAVTLSGPTSTVTSTTGTGTSGSSSVTTTTTTGTSTGSSSSSNSSSTTTTTSAQFPSLSGVPSCVSDCLASGISRVGCASVVDVNCFCINPLFTSELTACILAECPDQLSTSENLAQQFCNIASASPTLSFPPIPTTTTTTSSDPTTSTAPPTTTPTPTTSSSAISTRGYTSHETMLGLIVSAFGLVLGAYVMQ